MEPGDSDLHDRVEELESETDQHREWLQKMMPDRRGVIKGLGAAAIGGAAVGGATGGASAQSAAGQVGTASEPVDVEGAAGDFDSVNTGNLDTIRRAWASWSGEAYDLSGGDITTAIQDLNAAPNGAYLIVPEGEYETDTEWVAEGGKSIVSLKGYKHRDDVLIKASTNLSNRVVDIRGSHFAGGVTFDAAGNVATVAEYTDGTNNIAHVGYQSVAFLNPTGDFVFDVSNPPGAWNWRFDYCQFRGALRLNSVGKGTFTRYQIIEESSLNAPILNLNDVSNMEFYGGEIETVGSDGTATETVSITSDGGTTANVTIAGAMFFRGDFTGTGIKIGNSGSTRSVDNVELRLLITNKSDTTPATFIEANTPDGCELRNTYGSRTTGDTAIQANTGESQFSSVSVGPEVSKLSNYVSGAAATISSGDEYLIGAESVGVHKIANGSAYKAEAVDGTAGNVLSIDGNDRVRLENPAVTEQNVLLKNNGDVGIRPEGQDTVFFRSSSLTADSMTADPEGSSESGYVEVVIAGSLYQIPVYQA